MTGPLSYIGGKNRLASKIIPLFPLHQTYVEPFAGGAQVFFHKKPSVVEILNDLNGDIVNFFRVCQNHYEELTRYLRYCLASRELFRLFSATNPDTLTDIQRAGRFFYLQKNSFGGLVVKQVYHYGVKQRSNYNPNRIPAILEQTHQRLQRVQIEALPYERILDKYDRPETLFYLDPPYWGRALYKFNFSDEDFGQLRNRLEKLRGDFILSLNDLPEARRLFAGFQMKSVGVGYSAQRNTGRKYSELLIMNFKPSELADRP
jgi:DNA adenine methylase